MGECAEDILDGSCCQFCGVFFEEEHGYPVVYVHCWATLSKADRKNFQKAINAEVT